MESPGSYRGGEMSVSLVEETGETHRPTASKPDKMSPFGNEMFFLPIDIPLYHLLQANIGGWTCPP